jgi:hypothetical protein
MGGFMGNGSSFVCPNCGALLQAGARVCRDCGSDENTGWSESTYMDGIDWPFDEDDYEEVKARELNSAGGRSKKNRINWRTAIGAALLAAMLLAYAFRG